MLPLLAVLISIQANFEGGRLGQTERIGADHYRCHIVGQTDQEGRNRQADWYYFRVDHAAGHKLTFDLVDLAGEYNYKPNRGAITKDTLPFYSSDNITWHPVEEANYDPLFRCYSSASKFIRIGYGLPCAALYNTEPGRTVPRSRAQPVRESRKRR